MKKLILSLVLFLSTLGALAQKPSVVVAPFKSSSSVGEEVTEAIRQNVLKGVAATTRLDMISASSDASVIADYVINGQMTSGESTSEYNQKEGKTKYGATITLTLTITTPDGAIVGSKNYKLSASNIYNTKGEAVTAAVDQLNNTKLKKFVDTFFVSEGKIVELDQAKGKEVKTLYINLGSALGMQKGQKFEVFLAKTVAGRTILDKIGELKAENIAAEDLTLCKVTKGGKEILQNYNEGKDIVVKTHVPGPGIFDKIDGAIDSVL